MLLLPGQKGEAWETEQNNVLSYIGEQWIEKYFHLFRSGI
jgi:hypothetical protein